MSSTILPIHPITGLTALGMTSRGPIWPVIGGNGEDDGDTDDKPPVDDEDQGDDGGDNDADDDNDSDDGDNSDEDQLGDKGKRALDTMKSKWKAERAKRQAAEQRAAALESGDDGDSAQRAADQAALAKANERIVKAEVRAAAAGKLSDPADALKFLDLKQFEVGDDGEVDEEEIADAIADLVAKKPYLAAQGGKPKAPKPDRRQGGGQKDTAGSVASGLATYKARHNKN